MERSLLPLIVLVATGTVLRAQPVITSADAPQAGQSYQYVAGTYQTATATGEDATWDMSGVGSGTAYPLSFADPSASPIGDQFDGANLWLSTTGSEQFLRVDGTGLYIVGTYLSPQDITAHYTDDELVLPYPCTYNTEIDDGLAYSYLYGGVTVPGTGTATYVADGFGTLILPWGTLHNVLKVSGTDITHENFNGSDFQVTANITYFYRPGQSFYVFKIEDLTVSQDGTVVQTGQFLNYMTAASVGIDENRVSDIGISAFPVPASDALNIVFGLDGGRHANITLMDATGRTVLATSVNTASAGVQKETIGVQQLPAGMYLLQIVDDRGQRGTSHVVIK